MAIYRAHWFIGVGIFAFAASRRVSGTPVIPQQSSNISWFACPDSATTQCAFFDVPRDYSRPSDNDTVSIFMRKLPATVSAQKKLGSIITNPGGPGTSGNVFVLGAYGEMFQAITDGRYDLIGFDPRGVNLTGPWPSCFDEEAKAVMLDFKSAMVGLPYPHSSFEVDRAVVNKISSIQAGVNSACIKNGNRKMLQSVGTAFVVQDIIRMSEALGDDGVNYWGFSYGTVLGATLAAMHPDSVKRMVLDGVSNAESYYNDIWQWGIEGMTDTHKTYAGFLSMCAEAGPERCAFATPPKGSKEKQTTESLRKRVDNVINQLGTRPLVVASSATGPGIVTASDLQQMLLASLYNANQWPTMMEPLERGDGEAVYRSLYDHIASLPYKPYDQNIFHRPMLQYGSQESAYMILCSDTRPTNISVDAYTDYNIGKISPVGEQWAVLPGYCNGWSFQADQHYTGPWSSAGGLKKTRHPILFLSLDADAVAPLSSAIKMSDGFGKDSASLVVQHGFGHCTISHPSLCTRKHVHDYFVDGKVPANGTHCSPEPGYIYPANSTLKRTNNSLSKRERLIEIIEKQKGSEGPIKPTTIVD
ncbi:alpha/beta hydrolase family protein [Ceratobasidium sp. AG-Ba]|nr:alpha/beta hydrolase family protein [Ceratobasidium sp. AG-Ba]